MDNESRKSKDYVRHQGKGFTHVVERVKTNTIALFNSIRPEACNELTDNCACLARGNRFGRVNGIHINLRFGQDFVRDFKTRYGWMSWTRPCFTRTGLSTSNFCSSNIQESRSLLEIRTTFSARKGIFGVFIPNSEQEILECLKLWLIYVVQNDLEKKPNKQHPVPAGRLNECPYLYRHFDCVVGLPFPEGELAEDRGGRKWGWVWETELLTLQVLTGRQSCGSYRSMK